MIKKVKYLLIIFPIILSILLTINIFNYNNYKNKIKDTIENNNNYLEKINENDKQKEKLEINLFNLKEEKKDKIWEYDRWTKWNQEITEKID